MKALRGRGAGMTTIPHHNMNIGLIAMSGVHAHNEELTRLGLTLPGFVERFTHFDINILPRQMSVQELQAGFLHLVRTLYSEEETRWRRQRFKERRKRSPQVGNRARRSSDCLAA